MCRTRKSLRAKGRYRRGVTIVEGAIVLGVLLMLLFSCVELGIAVCRYNVLAAATRLVAREAVVRGSFAPPERSSWGPVSYAGNAADGSEVATIASPYLATMTPADVSIDINWLDSSNEEGCRVQVQLKYMHRPLVPLLGLTNTLQLESTSVARISH